MPECFGKLSISNRRENDFEFAQNWKETGDEKDRFRSPETTGNKKYPYCIRNNNSALRQPGNSRSCVLWQKYILQDLPRYGKGLYGVRRI
jgi:hypothetical protein